MRLADLFDNSFLYQLFQNCINKKTTSKFMENKVLKPTGVQKVLDFGCGNGNYSKYFVNSNYLGIDPLEQCVKRAKFLYGNQNANFINSDHTYLNRIPDSSFDLIIAIGVLHHIDDNVFVEFIEQSHRILKPGGRLTTLDPVLHSNQSKISRWVVKRDRGRWVRNQDLYVRPIANVFMNELFIGIHSGLLRIPYDHIHLEVFKNKILYQN